MQAFRSERHAARDGAACHAQRQTACWVTGTRAGGGGHLPGSRPGRPHSSPSRGRWAAWPRCIGATWSRVEQGAVGGRERIVLGWLNSHHRIPWSDETVRGRPTSGRCDPCCRAAAPGPWAARRGQSRWRRRRLGQCPQRRRLLLRCTPCCFSYALACTEPAAFYSC